MRLLSICSLFIFVAIYSLEGQDNSLHLGINSNPIRILNGSVEGVIMKKLSSRIRSKLAIGLTYPNNGPIKSRCGRIDDVKNREEKGWFTRFTTDYDLFIIRNMRLYAGLGLFYTKFESNGIERITQIRLNESGEIFTGGLELGMLTKVNKFITLDFGIQVFIYDGDYHQVGRAECLGTIPGFEAPSNPMGTIFIHVLFGK